MTLVAAALRAATAPAALALTLVLLAPGAAADDGSIAVDPAPIPARGTATVTVDFPVAVEEVDLRACRADGDRTILSCYPPAEMSRTGAGNWTASIPPTGGFAPAAYAGLNATGRTADGDVVHVPGNGTAYRFVAVASAGTGNGAPGPGTPVALAALVGAVSAAAALGRRGQP